MTQSKTSGAERRRSKRRPILESFSLFVVLPTRGSHRLAVHDVSDMGMRFDMDLDGESPADAPVQTGQAIEVHFYLNQRLYLPLDLKIIRIESTDGMRRVGAEFQETKSNGYKGFYAFLQMLDALSEDARFLS